MVELVGNQAFMILGRRKKASLDDKLKSSTQTKMEAQSRLAL